MPSKMPSKTKMPSKNLYRKKIIGNRRNPGSSRRKIKPQILDRVQGGLNKLLSDAPFLASRVFFSFL